MEKINRTIGFLGILILVYTGSWAQNVGISATGSNPHASSGLDVDFTNKGLLIPRVALTGTSDNSTVSNPATSLMVYNTATVSDVTPGYYYWTGSSWIRFSTGSSGGGSSWELSGNSGTVEGTNYLGTNDNVALTFKINGQKSGRIGKLTDGSLFLGYQAGNFDDLSNNRNTFLGYQVGTNTTIGNSNTAVGYGAYSSNQAGNSATAVGYFAMQYANNTASSIHNYNVAVGAYALQGSSTPGNNTGNQNAVVGAYTMIGNTTGSYNSAVGHQALQFNTSGNNNAALGFQALVHNTLGVNNTAQGCQAMYTNEEGIGNTANGRDAMYLNGSGDYNTAHGYQALYFNTTGNYNTALGFHTGITSGYGNLENTIGIGGQGNLEISANNMVRIGNVNMTSIGGQVVWTAISDERVKSNVKENVKGLDFILKLRPVTYTFNVDQENELMGITDEANLGSKYDIEKIRFSGFLAQEVDEAASQTGYEFSGVDKPAIETGLWGLRYAEFTVPLVKAVQEMHAVNQQQQQVIDELVRQNADLARRLENLERR